MDICKDVDSLEDPMETGERMQIDELSQTVTLEDEPAVPLSRRRLRLARQI